MGKIYKNIVMEDVLDIIRKRGFYYIRTKVLYPDFIGPEYIIVTDDTDIVKKHPKMAGIQFIAGAMVGVTVGVIAMCLCIAASRDDNEEAPLK
ncbi:MAG TPA: DUF3789 domain-containing protein [Ruminococcus sp.]|nr:DUF3789 domain-containing protein [Ruminococcus sp.]